MLPFLLFGVIVVGSVAGGFTTTNEAGWKGLKRNSKTRTRALPVPCGKMKIYNTRSSSFRLCWTLVFLSSMACLLFSYFLASRVILAHGWLLFLLKSVSSISTLFFPCLFLLLFPGSWHIYFQVSSCSFPSSTEKDNIFTLARLLFFFPRCILFSVPLVLFLLKLMSSSLWPSCTTRKLASAVIFSLYLLYISSQSWCALLYYLIIHRYSAFYKSTANLTFGFTSLYRLQETCHYSCFRRHIRPHPSSLPPGDLERNRTKERALWPPCGLAVKCAAPVRPFGRGGSRHVAS